MNESHADKTSAETAIGDTRSLGQAHSSCPIRSDGQSESDGAVPGDMDSAEQFEKRQPVGSAQGTDRSVKPSLDPARKSRKRKPRARYRLRGFSRLDGFILTVNLALLFVLVAGLIVTDRSRTRLLDARKDTLAIQGEMLAGAIAETAVTENIVARKVIDGVETPIPLINHKEARAIIQRLVLPTKSRARLYDHNGLLIGDSKELWTSQQIDRFELEPPGVDNTIDKWWDRAVDTLVSFYPHPDLQPYLEAPPDRGPQTYWELAEALQGTASAEDRRSETDGLIVSVAVPVQRLRATVGAVLLTTEGEDIEAIVRRDNEAVLRIMVMSLIVSLFLSAVLGRSIARPIRRLSMAAEEAASWPAGKRVAIPDLSHRHDEIGDLSQSFRRMTEALFARIEAIESFAADVSHELKNPLTSIRSAVDTIHLAKRPEDQARLLEVVREDVDRMDRLITDIANASRLDAELARGEMELVDLMELLDALVSSHEATRMDDGPTVTLSNLERPTESNGIYLLGFELRLGQVFSNLISNAVSFSPPRGEIKILVGSGDDEKVEDCVLIQVDDQGPGIPPDNLETIFERFYTSRPGMEFGKNSGLGLSISRQIIEAHGGRIWAENKSEGGARFCVTLPIVVSE